MLVFIALVASANEPVYVDALASGWSSWSWSGTYDLAATDLVVGGKSMKATEQAWGALSLHDGNGRMQAQAWTGLRFAFEGDGSKVGISLQSDTESYSSAAVAISTLATTSAGTFTTVTFDTSTLGNHAWTRINFGDLSGSGTVFHVDSLDLLDENLGPTAFFDAEPIGPSRILLWGPGDPSQVSVTLGGQAVTVSGWTALADRVYVDLGAPLGAGALVVTTADGTFTRALTTASVTLATTPSHPISPFIYGVAAPDDPATYVPLSGATP